MAKKEEIRFDRKNYRKHSDENKAVIARSLDECGAGRSILIDREGEIIAGNGVYEQAKAKGIPVRVVETDGSELVVVKRTDLATDDERRRRLALADNAASDLSEWDVPNLTADFDLDELGSWGVELNLGEDIAPTQKLSEGGEIDPSDLDDKISVTLAFTYDQLEHIKAQADGRKLEDFILEVCGYEG